LPSPFTGLEVFSQPYYKPEKLVLGFISGGDLPSIPADLPSPQTFLADFFPARRVMGDPDVFQARS
jgi:hypothetical protein